MNERQIEKRLEEHKDELYRLYCILLNNEGPEIVGNTFQEFLSDTKRMILADEITLEEILE